MQLEALEQLLKDTKASASAMADASKRISKVLWQANNGPSALNHALEELEQISAQTLRQTAVLEQHHEIPQKHPQLAQAWQDMQDTMRIAKAARQAAEMQIGRAMHANQQLLSALIGNTSSASYYTHYGKALPITNTGRSITKA